MRTTSFIAGCFAASLVATFPASAEGNCHVGWFARLPISIDQAGGVTVPLTVKGTTLSLLVDSGGVFSMLTDSAVARLSLRPKMMHFQGMTMFGGRKLDHYVDGLEIQLGGSTARDRTFVIIPDDSLPPGIDGLFGPDILAAFDADFDFAAGKLNLMAPNRCDGDISKVVYWADDPRAAIPFTLDEDRHINIDVTLDGKKVRATLDTGSSRSIMSLEAAEDIFGIDGETLKKNNSEHAFKQLTLEGVTVNSPAIILVPDDKSKVLNGYKQPELILGMGVLRQLHLYIGYKEKVVYVTPASARRQSAATQ
jgi:predicted aspartyl protease